MQLVESMCENNQVELLLRFNFVGFSNQLERALMSKLQSEDPLSKPDYAQILFAYYVQKGDYRNGMGFHWQIVLVILTGSLSSCYNYVPSSTEIRATVHGNFGEPVTDMGLTRHCIRNGGEHAISA